MSKFNFTWWRNELDKCTSARDKARLRYRNFVTVVYPDSAPKDWQKRLDDYCIQYIISPLHDRDMNSIGSEPKKPHYHVMVLYDNVKSLDQIKEVFDDIGGVGGEIVQSIRSQARYFCHLDNADKARYSVLDVKCGGGVDYDHIISLASDLVQATSMMCDVIESENILYFDEFVMWCRNHNMEWYKILSEKRAFFISTFINSRRRKFRDTYKN